MFMIASHVLKNGISKVIQIVVLKNCLHWLRKKQKQHNQKVSK